MNARGLAIRNPLQALGAVLLLLSPALGGCSNGNADSTQHGYLYDGGADSGATPDSTALGDVVVVPPDSGADSTTVDSTTPPDSGTDGALAADTAVDSGEPDSRAPADAAEESAPEASTDSGTMAIDSGADSGSDTGVDAADSGVDAADTSVDAADAGCTATMAIVGGSAGSVVASKWSRGTWSTAQTLAGSVISVPSVVSNGTAYLGIVREGTTNDIDYTLSGATWSALAGVPAAASATALTLGPPALTVIGSAAHLVYLGTDNKFYHGVYMGGAWTPADDPVQNGAVQTFGPSSPTAAGLTAGLSIVQAGMDSHVYTQGWDGSWQAPVQVATDAYNVVSPRVVALTGGTASEMVVYSRNDNTNDQVLMYSVLVGTTWTTPALVHDATVFTPNTVAIAPLANGAALLVYEGMNGQPYFTTYNPTSATPWSAAVPLFSTGNPTLTSPPQIAAGVCGALAVLVLAQTSSDLAVSTFTGSAWSALTLVSGTSGATFAAIATQP
jgi:hypothetical protein